MTNFFILTFSLRTKKFTFLGIYKYCRNFSSYTKSLFTLLFSNDGHYQESTIKLRWFSLTLSQFWREEMKYNISSIHKSIYVSLFFWFADSREALYHLCHIVFIKSCLKSFFETSFLNNTVNVSFRVIWVCKESTRAAQ